MITCDIVIIGGGPAGLAAAVSAYDKGVLAESEIFFVSFYASDSRKNTDRKIKIKAHNVPFRFFNYYNIITLYLFYVNDLIFIDYFYLTHFHRRKSVFMAFGCDAGATESVYRDRYFGAECFQKKRV